MLCSHVIAVCHKNMRIESTRQSAQSFPCSQATQQYNKLLVVSKPLLLIEVLAKSLELNVSCALYPTHGMARSFAWTHLLARLGLLETLGNVVGEGLDAGRVEDVGLAREILLKVGGVVGLGRVRLDRELCGVSGAWETRGGRRERGEDSRWPWSLLLPDMMGRKSSRGVGERESASVALALALASVFGEQGCVRGCVSW